MYKKYMQACYQNLSHNLSYDIASFLLSGQASVEESASLLTALNFQKSQANLLSGFAQTLKSKASTFKKIPDAMDVCGTGGDGHNTFNISTTVSLLLACQLPVVKHGNTSISSLSGSADVIKALDIPLLQDKAQIEDHISKTNYVFLYAPYMHPSMKHIMPVRKALSIPTVFNKVGPLGNPFDLDYQVIGVYDMALLKPMAQAMQQLNIKRGAVIHGHMGMDELSTTGINHVAYVTPEKITYGIINPRDFNIAQNKLEDFKGGNAHENAQITLDILSGHKGPKQDIVALNAGFAFFIGEKCPSIQEGIQLAYDLLNQKKGLQLLANIKEQTCQF